MNDAAAINVVHFHRRPQPGQFSLERLFGDVRRAMPTGVRCQVHTSPCVSRGLWRRLYNILEAPFFQGEINHVTGDVHYLDFLLHKRRTLLTIPDCASFARLQGWKRRVLRLFWYELPVRRAELISVISEATKNELLSHVRCPPEKIRVVHCCISPVFQPFPKPFDGQRPRLLQVGTAPNKNLLRVAEALSGLSCHLTTIGRLDAEQEMALQKHHINFTSLGEIKDEAIVDEYRRCDLVLFASTYEGFGLPIVEANAIGRPVVTSNLLSMPEVAGDAACLVDPFDVRAIRAGILRVIENAPYRQQLVENGYANARRFTPEAVAQQYVALYRELLERVCLTE